MPESTVPAPKVEVIHFDQRIDNEIRSRGRRIHEFSKWLRLNNIVATRCLSAMMDTKAKEVFGLIRSRDENKVVMDVKLPISGTEQLLAIEDITRTIKSKGNTIVNQNISPDPDNNQLCIVKFLISLA